MSKYVEELYKLADRREQDGNALDAEIARKSGKRMERMESLILEDYLAKESE